MNKSFLGTGWAFPPAFDANTGTVRMVSGEEDIRESLHILMGTRPKERVMQPGYGCGLQSLVFESIDENSISLVRETIRRAVLFYEPRIDLESILIDAGRQAEGVLYIELQYRVRATNNRSNIVYPFYFKEGTNLT